MDFSEPDGDVIVADGGSTDGTREKLDRWAASTPNVTVIDNDRRVQSYGLNAAAEAAAAPAPVAQGTPTFAQEEMILVTEVTVRWIAPGDLDGDGDIDIDALRDAVGAQTAGIMLTNPSTLGVFERDIIEVDDIVRDAGGLLYYDGANLNAILGKVRPGDFDADRSFDAGGKHIDARFDGHGPRIGQPRKLYQLIKLPTQLLAGHACAPFTLRL